MRKSNFIAAAMAFAALVGCQKEFTPVVGTEQAGNAGLDQRPVLASSMLTFGGPATRVEAGGASGLAWTWQVKDQVGAMLVDQIRSRTLYAKVGGKTVSAEWSYSDYLKGSKMYGTTEVKLANTFTDEACKVQTTSEAFYEVINEQVWTNYPYTTEDAKHFTTPATLVEGHYMFYAPYNENNGKRGPLVATLPVNQTVGEKGNEAVDAFFKGEDPVWLALDYLSYEETSSVDPSIGHIYSYPQFSIVNNYNGYIFDGENRSTTGTFLSTVPQAKAYTMTVKQIEFYAETADLLAYKREIHPKKLNAIKDWYGDNFNYKITSTSEVSKVVVPAKFKAADVKTYLVNGDEFEKNPLQRIVVTLDKELAPGESTSFNVVMPGENYTEGLYARILVEIDGKEYYILANEVTEGKYDAKAQAITMASTTGDYKGYAQIYDKSNNQKFIEGTGDYQFMDRHNRGSKDITLVRGQRYPAAEINDKIGGGFEVKSFKGELLTIELVGGLSQVAVAVATEKPKETPFGIRDNDDLVNFLNHVHRAAKVSETNDPEKATNPDMVDENLMTLKFYLEKDNEVIIDEKLIAAIATKIPEGQFTLITNLPIAEGVKVKVGDKNREFIFTAGNASCKIVYDNEAEFGPIEEELVNGINIVNNGTLVAAEGVQNAIVIVNGSATVKNPVGIAGIIVQDNAVLDVAATTDVAAWITATETSSVSLEMGSKGLVNKDNDFTKASISNQALAEIAGNVKGVVSFMSTGFVSSKIDANTRVNNVMINASMVQDKAFEVSRADFDLYEALTDVTYTFSKEFVKGLYSKSSIKIANAVKVVYAGGQVISWDGPKGVDYVTIQGKNADTKFVNFKPAGGVMLVSGGKKLTSDMVYNHDDVEEAAQEGDVTFGDNIDITVKNGAAIVMQKGATIDGNGFKLTASGDNAIGVQTTGGEIKDLTVTAPWKGVYAPLTGELELNNVTSTSTYALNVAGEGKLTVKDSKFYGWSSWGQNVSATFEGCYFGANENLNDIAPWNTTIFENCTFANGLIWDIDKENGVTRIDGSECIYLINCYVLDKNGNKVKIDQNVLTHFEQKTGIKNQGGRYTNDYFSIDFTDEQKSSRKAYDDIFKLELPKE